MERFIQDVKAESENSVALEQGILQKGKLATAGSKMLENFVAPFDAEVVDRLNAKNIPIAGRAGMDEFGISGTLPSEESLSPAIEAILQRKAGFALCNDLFGKQRRQAAENGLCYIHPSYGTASRYGLIPAASSMDQIGVVCSDLGDGFEILAKIAGFDPKDGAMFPEQAYSYAKQEKKLKVGIPAEIVKQCNEKTQAAISKFSGMFDTTNIQICCYEYFEQVLLILATAEICNNCNRYDGIKFGYRTGQFRGLEELYVKSRTEGFALTTKFASIMGAMVLSRDQYQPYYEQAMKIRRLIKQSLLFDEFDLIILPAKSCDSHCHDLPLYALSPLAGLPGISFSFEGASIQLVANSRNENALLTAWEVAQK